MKTWHIRFRAGETLEKSGVRVVLVLLLTIPTLLLATTPHMPYAIETSPTTVAVRNLTTDHHMEVLAVIDGCGQKLFVAPNQAVTVDVPRGRNTIVVKNLTLTPMQEILKMARAKPVHPAAQVRTPAPGARFERVCRDLP